MFDQAPRAWVDASHGFRADQAVWAVCDCAHKSIIRTQRQLWFCAMKTDLPDDDKSAFEARAADVRQAVSFSRWLQEELVEAESRITRRRSALAEHEARGEVAAARQLHRGNCSDELERDELRYMLLALHRRFFPAWIPPLPGCDTSPLRHTEPGDPRA